jgi:hypothetical protein
VRRGQSTAARARRRDRAERFLAEIGTTASLQQPYIPARSYCADQNNTAASGGSTRTSVTTRWMPVPGRSAMCYDPSRPWQHRACGFRVYRDRFYFTPGHQQSDLWMTEIAVPR